jgi:hypothetical protein
VHLIGLLDGLQYSLLFFPEPGEVCRNPRPFCFMAFSTTSKSSRRACELSLQPVSLEILADDVLVKYPRTREREHDDEWFG